jgi:hypothetical protein
MLMGNETLNYVETAGTVHGAAVIAITFYATTVAERRVSQAYLNSEFVQAAGLPSTAAVSPADNIRIATQQLGRLAIRRPTFARVREGEAEYPAQCLGAGVRQYVHGHLFGDDS